MSKEAAGGKTQDRKKKKNRLENKDEDLIEFGRKKWLFFGILFLSNVSNKPSINPDRSSSPRSCDTDRTILSAPSRVAPFTPLATVLTVWRHPRGLELVSIR